MNTLVDRIDRRIQAELSQQGVPGLLVCVRNDAEDSGLLFHKAYGLHDRKTKQVLDADALFLIASQSKTFTAVAILRLVEAGKLKLRDRLLDLLPELEKDPRHVHLADVTVETLLQHRAPLDWRGDLYCKWDIGQEAYPATETLCGPALFDKLDAERLTRGVGDPCYSNASYALLGAIIQQVTGRLYVEHIRRDILEPRGLDRIFPGLPEDEETASAIARGYYRMQDNQNPSQDDYKPSIVPDLRACTPSGGFYGSLRQVSKFYHLLFTDAFIRKPFLSGMLDYTQKFPEGMGLSCPQGMGTFTCDRQHFFGHGGGMTGYWSKTAHYRDAGITISVAATVCTLPNDLDPGRRMPSASESGLLKNIMTVVEETIAAHAATLDRKPEPPAHGPSAILSTKPRSVFKAER